MLPPALLRIVLLVSDAGRSSAFVGVFSQPLSSIRIGFAATALTAVLSPPPDDRSVQHRWLALERPRDRLARARHAYVCAASSPRLPSTPSSSASVRSLRVLMLTSGPTQPGRAGREAPPPRSGGLRWRHPTNVRVLLPCFRASDAFLRRLGMQGWHVSHTARPGARCSGAVSGAPDTALCTHCVCEKRNSLQMSLSILRHISRHLVRNLVQ